MDALPKYKVNAVLRMFNSVVTLTLQPLSEAHEIWYVIFALCEGYYYSSAFILMFSDAHQKKQ